MLHVVLYQPEIPPNTGNIIRLCANTGAWLHLIRPLGFTLDDASLRRAGLDYHALARVREHDSLEDFITDVAPARLWALSTRGHTRYDRADFGSNDALLFGPETRGLPHPLLHSMPRGHTLRLPMAADNRSLNLSNSVAVVLYEAWRRQDFAGGDMP